MLAAVCCSGVETCECAGRKTKQKGKQQSKLREAARPASGFRLVLRGGLARGVTSSERTATRTDY